MTEESADRWFPLIPMGLGAVLVVMALSFAGVGWHQLQKNQAMRTWPSVEGTTRGSGLSTSRESGESINSHYQVTSFEYVVEGKTYQFTQREYLGYGSAKQTPWVTYAPNQMVTIYFDPLEPEAGSLTNERKAPDLLFLGLGALCALVSFPFWLFGIRGLRRSRRDGLRL